MKNEREVYLLLTGKHRWCNGEQWCANRIARSMKISSVAVNRIIRKLLHEKYITCDTPNGKPKLYSVTKNRPIFEKEEMQTTLESFSSVISQLTRNTALGEKQKLQGTPVQGGVFTTSKSTWGLKVEKMTANDDDLKGWKKYMMKNGVIKYHRSIWFDEPVNAPLEFQLTGRNNWSLTVTIPRWTFGTVGEYEKAEAIIGYYASMALTQIIKKFHLGGADVRTIKKIFGEFETPLREPDIKRMIDKAHVMIRYKKGFEDIHYLSFDGSGKVDRLESDAPEWIEDYVSIPLFRRRLEKNIKVTEELLDGNVKTQEIIENLSTSVKQIKTDVDRLRGRQSDKGTCGGDGTAYQ